MECMFIFSGKLKKTDASKKAKEIEQEVSQVKDKKYDSIIKKYDLVKTLYKSRNLIEISSLRDDLKYDLLNDKSFIKVPSKCDKFMDFVNSIPERE